MREREQSYGESGEREREGDSLIKRRREGDSLIKRSMISTKAFFPGLSSTINNYFL